MRKDDLSGYGHTIDRAREERPRSYIFVPGREKSLRSSS